MNTKFIWIRVIQIYRCNIKKIKLFDIFDKDIYNWMTPINVYQHWSVKNRLINFSLNLLYKKGMVWKVLLFFRFFFDWLALLTVAIGTTVSWRMDRACGLPIVGYVTRGNLCSGEQYVALTYCTSATSTSWCCHATHRYRNSRYSAICILWKGEFPRIRATESRTFLSSLYPRNSETK